MPRGDDASPGALGKAVISVAEQGAVPGILIWSSGVGLAIYLNHHGASEILVGFTMLLTSFASSPYKAKDAILQAIKMMEKRVRDTETLPGTEDHGKGVN